MADNDEFGTMQASDELQARVSQLETREQELLRIQAENEEEFGKKRARFKELFLDKEAELKTEQEGRKKAEAESKTLGEELQQVKAELNDIKMAVAVSEANKEEEIMKIRGQCDQEVATMQSLLREAADEASKTTAAQYEVERTKLQELNETYEEEIQTIRNKMSQDRKPGFISSVVDMVSGGTASLNTSGTTASEAENLEDSMRKAQHDAMMLKSVVVPLEAEIESLKKALEEERDKVRDMERLIMKVQKPTVGDEDYDVPSPTDLPSSSKSLSLPSLDDISDRDDKIAQLTEDLKTEKGHRTDMEMYAAVLEVQKHAMQDDVDRMKAKLAEVCKVLEEEKRAHSDLRQTWNMSADEFLEDQRVMMTDMRRMEAVLSAEQQRVIAEQKNKDKQRELQERKMRLQKERKMEEDSKLDRQRGLEAVEKVKASAEKLKMKEALLVQKLQQSNLSRSNTSLNSTASDDSRIFDDSSRFNSTELYSSDLDLSKQEYLDSGVHEPRIETTVRISPDKVVKLPPLTDAQMKAITDPTPDMVLQESRVATATQQPAEGGISLEGRRLVSGKEWQLLQEEVKAAREKLGRPCDMCNNYEAQLQNVQDEMKEEMTKARSLERNLTSERQILDNQKKYIEQLETSLKDAADNAQKEISSLVTKVQECEKYIQELKQQHVQSHLELQEHQKQFTADREEVQKELVRLQEENDSLVGKHSKNAQQLQNEDINLPNNLEEMQLLLLKYREDIITAKVAQQHTDETLRSQIMFLKDQVQGEQQERTTTEETLTQEINGLQEKLVVQESLRSELERESSVRSEAESKLREMEQALKSHQAKSKQLIHGLQQQLEEQSNARTKSENEVQVLERKVQSLQNDLGNSEAVQADFVKLSQSLQIQLESFRQEDKDVRWENEDDVDICKGCKQSFSVTVRKHHCRHCGKVFCSNCTQKTVHSGPKMRPAKVCDVCHTILNKDAMPYFSTEAPNVPD